MLVSVAGSLRHDQKFASLINSDSVRVQGISFEWIYVYMCTHKMQLIFCICYSSVS